MRGFEKIVLLFVEHHQRDFIMRPEPSPIKAGVLLELGTVDAFGTEMVWRVGPGKVTTIPTVLSNNFIAADMPDDLENQRRVFLNFVSRSELVLVPLCTAGHWTVSFCQYINCSA